MSDELSTMVWKVLKGNPIDVIDEDNNSVWEHDLWELTEKRLGGEFAGTTSIGSGNIIVAMNLVRQKLIIKKVTDDNMYIYKNILDKLAKENLIRKNPEQIRKTFKVV